MSEFRVVRGYVRNDLAGKGGIHIGRPGDLGLPVVVIPTDAENVEALEQVVADAIVKPYPRSVFEPLDELDMKTIRGLLEDHGYTMDGLAAHIIRLTAPAIAENAVQALGITEVEGDD